MKRTPLFPLHEQLGGKMVPFEGWEMPVHYGSQLDEHQIVRHEAGMFDVSHMNFVEVKGKQATEFLSYLLANDIAKAHDGRGLYSCMLNEKGGVIDDLIAYRMDVHCYHLILNAGTRDKDQAWILKQAEKFSVECRWYKDRVLIAIQGPKALAALEQVANRHQQAAIKSLKFFDCVDCEGWFIARTGYTGEEGAEIVLEQQAGIDLWQFLIKVGVKPCGLGARDTLRLEAGLSLYGQDLDEDHSPLASNLKWTVVLDDKRDFIGKQALLQEQQAGVLHNIVGLKLLEKGIPRAGYAVEFAESGKGVVTSGSFSPMLDTGIALARVDSDAAGEPAIIIRGRRIAVECVKLPFVKKKPQSQTI